MMRLRPVALLVAAAFLGTAEAQSPAPRPANAPALAPLTLQRDGNFRIAPPYADDPAFIEKANVPKGTVYRFLMHSADSKIYPTAPGVNGAPDAPFDRTV